MKKIRIRNEIGSRRSLFRSLGCFLFFLSVEIFDRIFDRLLFYCYCSLIFFRPFFISFLFDFFFRSAASRRRAPGYRRSVTDTFDSLISYLWHQILIFFCFGFSLVITWHRFHGVAGHQLFLHSFPLLLRSFFVQLDFMMFYWVLLGFAGLYWVLLGNTYWVLLGFIRVLLGF